MRMPRSLIFGVAMLMGAGEAQGAMAELQEDKSIGRRQRKPQSEQQVK
jgi:hypothetical protein